MAVNVSLYTITSVWWYCLSSDQTPLVVQASGEEMNWCCFILDNCLVKLTVHSLVQKIGDSYRGYCVSETELESILTFHKQQTQSVWGTRQSPSPAKPATRLMWKSQYVPYDGIPFVNAGTSHQLLTGSTVAVLYCEHVISLWEDIFHFGR